MDNTIIGRYPNQSTLLTDWYMFIPELTSKTISVRYTEQMCRVKKEPLGGIIMRYGKCHKSWDADFYSNFPIYMTAIASTAQVTQDSLLII
jgi:hypothetical protein